MINVKFYQSDLHCPGAIRGENVAREINRERTDCRIDCKENIPISDFYGTDLMVFQRQVHPLNYEKMVAAQRQGIKCVYELDDDILNIPPDFVEPYNFYAKEEVRGQVVKFLRTCDAITVSTYTLALSLKTIVGPDKPIYVVPNFIDMDKWDTAHAIRQTERHDCITIGWMASKSHKIDVAQVSHDLERIMADYQNVNISLIGWIDTTDLPWAKQYNGRVKMSAWVDISMLPMAMKDFDIGLAPLADNQFNRCKSNLKFQSLGALGIPCVASPLPPYENIVSGRDGVLVEGDDWYGAIAGLLDDKEKRALMGAEARRTVLAQWDLRKNTDKWVDIFKKIVQGD